MKYFNFKKVLFGLFAFLCFVGFLSAQETSSENLESEKKDIPQVEKSVFPDSENINNEEPKMRKGKRPFPNNEDLETDSPNETKLKRGKRNPKQVLEDDSDKCNCHCDCEACHCKKQKPPRQKGARKRPDIKNFDNDQKPQDSETLKPKKPTIEHKTPLGTDIKFIFN